MTSLNLIASHSTRVPLCLSGYIVSSVNIMETCASCRMCQDLNKLQTGTMLHLITHRIYVYIFFKRHQDSASLEIKFFFPPILAENIPSFNLQLRRSTSAGRRCGPRCTQDCSCKSALPAPPPGTGTGACSSWLRGDKARQVLIRPAGGATSYWMRETHQDASSVPSSTKKAAV